MKNTKSNIALIKRQMTRDIKKTWDVVGILDSQNGLDGCIHVELQLRCKKGIWINLDISECREQALLMSGATPEQLQPRLLYSPGDEIIETFTLYCGVAYMRDRKLSQLLEA